LGPQLWSSSQPLSWIDQLRQDHQRPPHLLTYGEQPSSVVILERRYGPRQLRDDDDDDEVCQFLFFISKLNDSIQQSIRQYRRLPSIFRVP